MCPTRLPFNLFILYHGKRHPVDMGAAEVEAFLTYLATQHQVSDSTQNKIINDTFLYH